jgi:hypothetical protein
MPQAPDENAFQQFIAQRRRDLQRISRATRGEHRFDDVVNEAWIQAYNMRASDGNSIDLSGEEGQQLLLKHLYAHLVHFTERKIRNAVRLDHAPRDNVDGGGAHPLMHMLASNDRRDVLDELIQQEACTECESRLIAHGSLAVAYVYLLRRYGNNMAAVANYLRISRSYAYHCRAKAERLAICMLHIPMPSVDQFVPGPWRRFRLCRPHVQLEFDFNESELI